MMKNYYVKQVGLVAAFAIIGATMAQAADLAAANTTCSGIEAMVAQANANVAVAAVSSDTATIKGSLARAAAAEAALAKAKAALEQLENAEDEAAEGVAQALIDAAYQEALSAMVGPVPEAPASEWAESETNVGGSDGSIAPNLSDTIWETQGLRQLYQSMFGNYWATSGGDLSFGDRDATPE